MKKGLATTLFTCLSILGFASDMQVEQALDSERDMLTEENVIVDSRPLSSKKKKLMQQRRQEEAQESEELSDQETVELSAGGLIIPIKTHNLTTLASNYMNATAASYSPYLYHWIDGFPQTNILKLEDGSEWIFDANKDGYIVRSWRPGDTLVIAPMGGWLWGSNYGYVLTNKDLGTSISVNPFLGPIAFGPLTTWIVGIDYNISQVYLLNGQGERTVWEVSNTDQYLFKEWAVNDTIIVGENSSWLWWFSSYNHIMINVNMNHNVRARQVSSSPNFRNGSGGGNL